MNPLTRRQFLVGAGGFTLALPFLPSVLAKELSAKWLREGANLPTRLVCILSPLGAVHFSSVFPSRSPSKEHPYLPSHPIYSASLKNTVQSDGQISSLLGPDFNSYADKLNILKGIDLIAELSHHSGGFLGNQHSLFIGSKLNLNPHPTIDQTLAYSDQVYPNPEGLTRCLTINPYANQGLGWYYSDPLNQNGNIAQIPAVSSPRVLFERLFNTIIEKTKVKVVNQVIEHYRSLKRNRRISHQDKHQLESHMTHLHELELKLISNKVCKQPTFALDVSSNPYQLHNDIIVAAFRCGLTRVATVFAQNVNGHGPEAQSAWHQASHNYSNPTQQKFCFDQQQWVAKNIFLDLIQKLDVPETEESTYLDNSTVCWGFEQSFPHLTKTMPLFLAGSAGGFFKTGQYVSYQKRTGPLVPATHVRPGLLLNQLWITLLKGMGVSQQAGYGDVTDNSKNDASRLVREKMYQPAIGVRTDLLPVIT